MDGWMEGGGRFAGDEGREVSTVGSERRDAM